MSNAHHLANTRELDVAALSRQSLQEIEECRPFVASLMCQTYSWIPQYLPLWLGVCHPWLKSYQNKHIPNDKGVELVRHFVNIAVMLG